MVYISFLADATDETDIAAVVAEIESLGGIGDRCDPTELVFSMETGHIEVLRNGSPFHPDLVVGWLFEDWLAPGMAILDVLELAGIRVINQGAVLFRGQNKATMSAALSRSRVPNESVLFSVSAQSEHLPEAEFPAVLKPALAIAGGRTVVSSGRGVSRVFDAAALEATISLLSSVSQPLYLQRYIERPDNRDIRVWAFGFQAVCACYKIPSAGKWISNTDAGSTLRVCELTEHLVEVSCAAARSIDAKIAGIDVAENPDGRLTVLEVNTCPTFLRAAELFGTLIPSKLANFLAKTAGSKA